jgi:hypothetical protein
MDSSMRGLPNNMSENAVAMTGGCLPRALRECVSLIVVAGEPWF